MKALKFIIYLLLGIAALIAGLGLFAKDTYHIERSIEIDAPDSLVYDQLRLYENFKEWSPWTKLDTTAKITLTGTDGTAGFSFAWDGNEDVGVGKQTLKNVSPNRLDYQLDLEKPFKSSFPVYFTLSGNKEKCKVTWVLDPKLPFPINVWAMFTDMDKAMGNDYGRGLGYLKRRCEGMAHKKYHGYEVAEEDLPEATYIGVRATLKMTEMDSFYQEHLPKIMNLIDSLKMEAIGAPTGLYWTWDKEAGETDMAVAIPVKKAGKLPKGFQAFATAVGKALIIDYLGDYSELEEAHLGMDDYMESNKLRSIPPVLEWYLSDPAAEPDTAKWLTKVVYFVEANLEAGTTKE